MNTEKEILKYAIKSLKYSPLYVEQICLLPWISRCYTACLKYQILIFIIFLVFQHQRKRNARHNIMSPITIGAFTCMAVIALSGFVMAIIKYKREHRVVNDKETQSP